MKIICAFSLIILLIMSGIAPILVMNIQRSSDTPGAKGISPLIVTFGSSIAERSAKNQLLENFPNSKVIDFDQIKSYSHYSGPIIYIGHSDIHGIYKQGSLIKWDTISKIIDKSFSEYHFFVACDSATIAMLQMNTDKHVIGFDGVVDALWVTSIISLQIVNIYQGSRTNLKLKFFKMALERAIIGPDNPKFLKMGWSSLEGVVILANIIITVSSLVFLSYSIALSPFASTIAAEFAEIALWMQFAFTTFDLLMGPTWAKAGNFFSALSSVLPLFAQFIISEYGLIEGGAINAAAYSEYLVAAAKIAVFLAALGMAIINIQTQIEYMDHDLNDCNDTPAQYDRGDTGCSSSPPPSPPPGGYY